MKKFLLLFILFLTVTFSSNLFAQGTNCANATPFCTGATAFPSPTNTSAQSGPDYGCLLSQPNPAWFYFQVSQSGNIIFTIEQNDLSGNGIDVDFIVWGPFASPVGNCGNLTASNDVDCSFAPDPIETVTIPNAQVGQYYILLVTNFDGAAGNVTFQQTGGTGATDCALLCPKLDIAALDGSGNLAPVPSTLSCSAAPITLYANQSNLPIGQNITPCYKFIVNPTNAEATANYSAEFTEDGFSFGCFGPNGGGGNPSCTSPISSIPGNSNWTVWVSYVSPTANQEQIRLCESSGTGSDLNYEVRDCYSNALITSGSWATDGACSNVNFSPAGLSGISYFSGPGVSTTDWGAGQFDPAAAGPGTHTVYYHWNDENGCDDSVSVQITVTSPNNPAWTPPSLCNTSTALDLDNSVTGTTGGTWSGGAYVNSGGVFNPATAGVGTHTVTYTVGTGTCQATSTQNVIVSAGGSSAWSAPPSICVASATNINLYTLVTGNPGGTWSGPGVVDSTFNPATAGIGNHTVVYSVGSGSCISTTSQVIQVSASDNASLSYPNSAYCITGSNPTPVLVGTSGGSYSSTTGISLDPSTGVVNLGASTPGVYDIIYQTTGSCATADTFKLTITANNVTADFAVPQSICTNNSNTSPVFIGSGAAGVFSSSPVGLVFVDSTTGVIDVGSSLPGTYEIVNTISSASGCAPSVFKDTIVINPIPNADFTIADTTLCSNNLPITLVPASPGGSFIGQGVTGSVFNPSGLPAGSYTVSYVIIDPNKCQDSTAQTINILPSPVVTLSANTVNLCEGQNDTLIATGNASTYTWVLSGAVLSNNDTLVLPSNLTQGSYNYSLIAEITGACSDTLTVNVNVDTLPTVNILNPTNPICEGESTVLTAVSSGGVFSWSTGSSSNAINVNPTVTTSYTVTATGLNGCKDTAQYTLNVNPAPAPASITSGNTASACSGSSVTITAVSANATSINVYSGSTLIGNYPNPASVVVNPTSQTTYYFEASSANSCGQVSSLDSVVVSVNPLPDTSSATFTNPSICRGDTTTIDLVSGASNPYEYLIWGLPSGGVGSIGTVGQTTFSPNATTTYYISFEDTITGCIATVRKPVTITVNPLPLAPQINLSDNSICLGNSINITAVGSGTGAVYNFYDAATGGTLIGSTNGSTPVVITPSAVGTFHIYAEAVSAQNCPQSAPRTDSIYVVNPNPTVSGASVTDATCELSNGGVTGINSAFSLTYTWTNLSGQVVGNTSNLTGVPPGVYSLVITEVNTGCVNNYAYTVNNVSNIFADFTANDTLFTLGDNPAGVVFTNNSTGAVTYTWDFDNGSTSNSINPAIEYFNAGLYEVILTAQGPGTCIDYDTLFIRVVDSLYTWYPNIFTPNGDAVNDVFFIKSTQIADVEVKIFNRWGILMYSYVGIGGFWDGRTTAGSEASDGDYYFMLEGNYKDGTPIEDKNRTGYIRLIRSK